MDKRTLTTKRASQFAKKLHVKGELTPGSLMQKINARAEIDTKKEVAAIKGRQETVGKGRVLSAARKVAPMM